MALKFTLTKFIACCLVLIVALGALLAINFEDSSPAPEQSVFPGITLGLTAEARESLQTSGQAFPADAAGFSAYYRLSGTGNDRLNKGAIDDYIFKPVGSGSTTLKADPAVLTAMGANYTVASLPLLNIDGIKSTVNVYYDGEGWVVAYLPKDAPSSQIWQARMLDVENPSLSDDNLTHTLLDAINVVIDEALQDTAITAADLDYYHWQHPEHSSFLMMALARGSQGGDSEPVSFAVPATLNIAEVSGTMWISQDVSAAAPCATFTLDGSDLISQKCGKGFYHATTNANTFSDSAAHSFKLVQSGNDAGASGALLMLVYSAP